MIVLERLQRTAVKQEGCKDAVKCLGTTSQDKGTGGRGFLVRSICIK